MHRRTLFYTLVRPWTRWAINLLFKLESVHGAEHFPKKGAALLYANHQNGLIDPICCCVILGRQLHFFTRADVFRSRLGRFFLFGVNMMPVYRTKDRVKDLAARNQRTFQSAIGRLKTGAVLGIFPEGGHHHDRRLRPFRNGLARFLNIALDAGLGTKEMPLKVVPVTINFSGLYAYRSRLNIDIQASHNLRDLVSCSELSYSEDLPDSVDKKPLNASHRVAITEKLRGTLIGSTPQLLSGALNPAHLAVSLYLEGTGLRDQLLRDAILSTGNSIEKAHASQPDGRTISQFEKLAESAGPAIESPIYEALGRLDAHGRTRLKTGDVLRAPFWLVHRVTVRPWIGLFIRISKRKAVDISTVSTLIIPMIMFVLPLVWMAISLALTTITAPDASAGITLLHAAGLFSFLRFSQAVAMPMEDRILHRKAEKKARGLLAQSKFEALWETWSRSVGMPR